MTDVIDRLAGIDSGTSLDVLRRSRPVRRDEIQAGYDALFEPANAGEIPLVERFAVAAFVADLQDHGGSTSSHYLAELVDERLRERIRSLAVGARQRGPWGEYREPGLQDENEPGEWFVVPDDDRRQLGERLSAVLEHAHFVVLHPRDARPEVLSRLTAAGWGRRSVVTWSQLIAYVSFQVRVVEGLRVLRAEGEGA
ncbi:CMD domain protein [Blastococcus sp. Marseille-P5729]|uniref:CMD domain protein n=1 Tax=Blastococcus sp. Marseille-P5729 TaxID=2086582 RepID=UPI000D0F6EAC|nr:CMD domain protein [Blastococcus sp. Marseille-P5729]